LARWPQYARLQHFRAVLYDSNFGNGRLEFLQAFDKSAADQLILEKGYRDKDIAEIAREAAIENGMSK
jgi:hypothetical protein